MGNRPQNKKDFEKLRAQFQNTMYLCGHLYKDTSLRDDMRMVACAVDPYIDEYSAALQCQKSSQEPCLHKMAMWLVNQSVTRINRVVSHINEIHLLLFGWFV